MLDKKHGNCYKAGIGVGRGMGSYAEAGSWDRMSCKSGRWGRDQQQGRGRGKGKGKSRELRKVKI